MNMARIFVVLRESLKELENFYKNLAIVNGLSFHPIYPMPGFFCTHHLTLEMMVV